MTRAQSTLHNAFPRYLGGQLTRPILDALSLLSIEPLLLETLGLNGCLFPGRLLQRSAVGFRAVGRKTDRWVGRATAGLSRR